MHKNSKEHLYGKLLKKTLWADKIMPIIQNIPDFCMTETVFIIKF